MDQNDFAARLARIQEKNQQDGQNKAAAPAETPRLDAGAPHIPGDLPPDLAGGGGGGPNFIAWGMILTLLVGVGGLGTLYVLNQNDKVAGVEVTEAAPQATEPATAETPAVADAPQVVADAPQVLTFKASEKARRALPSYTQERGWRYGPGDVVTAASTTLPLAELVTGFDPNRPPGAPREVAMFDPNPECTLRRPAAGEVVHNVRLEQGAGDSQVHIVPDEQLAEGVLDHITGLTRMRKKYQIGKIAENNAGRVDVLVTDTSAPVYLVLQSMYDNTLWNVHRGPGVTIAHVAMIGNASGLIAPQGVGFEALRISDFVDPGEMDFERSDIIPNTIGRRDLTSANGTIRPCMVAPYRETKADWHATGAAEKGHERYTNQMTVFTEGHAAFAAWYMETLGVVPNVNLVSGEWAHHVLVGPRPETPLGYREVTGQTINFVRTDNIFESDAALIQAHRDLLTRATGGDPFRLDPAPMEFASQ